MISCKPGVKANGMKPEILFAIMVADQIYSECGAECVITEITGGKHGHQSLHYVGYAVDLRTRHLTGEQAASIVSDLKSALTDEYDVILESNHIHIEFQPKWTD